MMTQRLKLVADPEELKRFDSKVYRDSYLHSQVRSWIGYQFRALRQKFGISQSQMAERTGKTQSVISRLESTEYGKVSVQTLLDVASSLDVALLIRFVSYPDFLDSTRDKSEAAMQPDTYSESREAYARLMEKRQLDSRKVTLARSERPWNTSLLDDQYPQASPRYRNGPPLASALSGSRQWTPTASAMDVPSRVAP